LEWSDLPGNTKFKGKEVITMNKKIMFVVLVGSLLVSPMAAFSQEAVAVKVEETAAQKLSGTVLSIDAKEKYLVIQYKVEGQEATESAVFYFSETLAVMKNGETLTSSELKEGDNVSIEYTVDGNNNKVISTLTLEG
jgi:hypothetical protein